MQPRIENLKEIKLVGKRIKTSFTENQTALLWRSFIPGRKEIRNGTGTELYSVEIYPAGFFRNFSPKTQFEKWAAAAVTDFTSIPEGMETMIIPGGLYAVFLHHGPASTVPQSYQDILGNWLTRNGEFILDDRPHFAMMGEKYRNESPDSEEELWIPVKKVA
jgi:AraC family transcriptional regulator